MTCSKEDFLKTFLPESVEEVKFVQINFDITDLSVSDILRNMNNAYPPNTRQRNAIASGRMAVGILCKTDTLEPMQGIFIVIVGGGVKVKLVSRRYIVVSVDESKLYNDADINQTIVKITDALVSIFKDDIDNLGDFFRKFIYDPYELEESFDDYAAESIND